MKDWVAAGNTQFTFHDLRAKAMTDVIEQGGKKSELTGHPSEAIPARVYDRRRRRVANAVR
jgi:integrase